MTKLDKSRWLTSSYDDLKLKVDAILRAAGHEHRYVIFSIFETVTDGVRDDLADWTVRHPDFAAPFAEGKVQFDLGDDENGHAVLSKGYLNPTWADVLVEAERSCAGRATEEGLDHVFLEAVELDGTGAEGQSFYALHFGS